MSNNNEITQDSVNTIFEAAKKLSWGDLCWLSKMLENEIRRIQINDFEDDELNSSPPRNFRNPAIQLMTGFNQARLIRISRAVIPDNGGENFVTPVELSQGVLSPVLNTSPRKLPNKSGVEDTPSRVSGFFKEPSKVQSVTTRMYVPGTHDVLTSALRNASGYSNPSLPFQISLYEQVRNMLLEPSFLSEIGSKINTTVLDIKPYGDGESILAIKNSQGSISLDSAQLGPDGHQGIVRITILNKDIPLLKNGALHYISDPSTLIQQRQLFVVVLTAKSM